MTETVGFIGLGLMGRPMALNLRKAGFPLVVHSRSSPPVDALVAAGAERAVSPRDVAARATRIITMLPDSPDVELVLDHQHYANLLWWVSLVFLLVVVAAFVLLPGPTGLANGSLDHAGSTSVLAARALPALLAVVGIATLVLCVLTGDAGARSVWGS
jgi:hypothetical protein